MSTLTIESVLATKLAEITPSLATAYPNAPFVPVQGVPYQQVDFLFSRPSNDYIHRGFNQSGFMQVTLRYPELVGPKDCLSRAELIRAKFKSGSVFSGVHITGTPEIGAGRNEDSRFVIPVFINFSLFIAEI